MCVISEELIEQLQLPSLPDWVYLLFPTIPKYYSYNLINAHIYGLMENA